VKQGRRGEQLENRKGGDQEQGGNVPEAIHGQLTGAALARLRDGNTILPASSPDVF
jgi:hypothetical protein